MLESPARKILVIENSPECSAKLKTLLSYLGCSVKTTHCGYTGLQLARSFRPETIVCSTGLPRMNGFQVARELRGDPETAAIRLIAIIDFRASTLQDLEGGSDFDLHLFKPVTILKLRDALNTLREQRSPLAGKPIAAQGGRLLRSR